jgi:hypothetical protein
MVFAFLRPEELVFGTLRNLQKIAQTEDVKASQERILHMVDGALLGGGADPRWRSGMAAGSPHAAAGDARDRVPPRRLRRVSVMLGEGLRRRAYLSSS